MVGRHLRLGLGYRVLESSLTIKCFRRGGVPESTGIKEMLGIKLRNPDNDPVNDRLVTIPNPRQLQLLIPVILSQFLFLSSNIMISLKNR